jgi:CheY-like chemotaxis protein/HPt (histidine-containing phosphotransfer) domain-containing protein
MEHKSVEGQGAAIGDAQILVVDDSSLNLTVALAFFAAHNIFADKALSGREAIEMVQHKRYDLVFMDHMMPEMDGAEAAKIIRSLDDPWLKEMPIIALSANTVAGTRELFLESGMNDFISKPMDRAQLSAALAAWLPGGKAGAGDAEGKAGEGQETEYDDLLEDINEIEEINAAGGLSHAGNNKTAFLQILRQFCRECRDYLEGIKKFCAEENWPEYAIRIHALKGVFANIGAEALSEWAAELEYASKNNDYPKCKAETEKIRHAIRAFRDKLLLTGLLAGEEKKDTSRHVITEKLLIEKLEAAREACSHGATGDADSLGDELKGVTVNETIDPLIKELCDLIESMDYDIAGNKIGEMLSLHLR